MTSYMRGTQDLKTHWMDGTETTNDDTRWGLVWSGTACSSIKAARGKALNEVETL